MDVCKSSFSSAEIKQRVGGKDACFQAIDDNFCICQPNILSLSLSYTRLYKAQPQLFLQALCYLYLDAGTLLASCIIVSGIRCWLAFFGFPFRASQVCFNYREFLLKAADSGITRISVARVVFIHFSRLRHP